jgi:Flp pilus assembly protein TadG
MRLRRQLGLKSAGRRTSLAGDRRGATLLEFAFVAAPFIALVFAGLETAVQTTNEAMARTVLTGDPQRASMSQSAFKTAACAQLPPFLSCSNLYIDVQSAQSFGSINRAPVNLTFDTSGNVTNSFTYNLGTRGDVVLLRMFYLFPVVSGPLGLSFATVGRSKRLLMGTMIAKTEPY